MAGNVLVRASQLANGMKMEIDDWLTADFGNCISVPPLIVPMPKGEWSSGPNPILGILTMQHMLYLLFGYPKVVYFRLSSC